MIFVWNNFINFKNIVDLFVGYIKVLFKSKFLLSQETNYFNFDK